MILVSRSVSSRLWKREEEEGEERLIAMPQLPDELWNRIFEIGIETSKLGCRELCCLAIACRRLRCLSSHSSLWSSLIAVDFPRSKLPPSSLTSPVPAKSSYRALFEIDLDRKKLASRREAFFAESKVASCRMEMETLRSSISGESERLKEVYKELLDLERARSASVALNVWQPEVIRGRHTQMVQQCSVPMDLRVRTLQMEVKVCKQRLEMHKRAYGVEKIKLKRYKEALESLRYHPAHSRKPTSNAGDHGDSNLIKRKRSSESVSWSEFIPDYGLLHGRGRLFDCITLIKVCNSASNTCDNGNANRMRR